MQVPTVFTTALLLLFSTAEAEVVGSVTIGTTGEVHNNSFKFFAIQTKVVFFADCLHLAPVWRHIRLRRRHCNHTWKLSWICAEEQCGDNWA